MALLVYSIHAYETSVIQTWAIEDSTTYFVQGSGILHFPILQPFQRNYICQVELRTNHSGQLIYHKTCGAWQFCYSFRLGVTKPQRCKGFGSNVVDLKPTLQNHIEIWSRHTLSGHDT